MRYLRCYLSIALLLFASLLICARVHVSELEQIQGIQYLPDMAGYVNIKDTGHNVQPDVKTDRTLPQAMAGFPLTYSSANTYNGAVYTNMDSDPQMEMIFGVGKKLVAFNMDGSLVPGWPVSLTQYVWGSPAIGDIDGDNDVEVVCTSRNSTNGNAGNLYAFHLDGTAVSGFPVTQTGGGTMNVCLANVAGSSALEILVNIRNSPNGWTFVYNGSGQVLEGWPQQLDTFPGAGISAGDIDNDGDTEIISLSYNSLYVFNSDGTIATGFPVSFPGITYSYSSPVLIDLDGDNSKEIVFGGCSESTGTVYVINNNGTVRTGWPKTTSSWIFATVSIGDINNNGEMDILVGDQTSSNEPANYIYAWDKNGNALTGYPAGPYFAIYTQSAIADIDGDHSTDIIFSSNLFGGGYDCINSNGSHKTDWPLPVGNESSAVTMMTTPVVGDFNLDGNLEIAGASTGFSSWVVELYLWSTGALYNDSLAYMTLNGCNIRHDGVYNHESGTESLIPPSNLMAFCNGNHVTLNWFSPNNSLRNLLGFNVYRNNTLITTTPLADTLSIYTDQNLTNGDYTYGVTAVYTSGESQPVTFDINVGNEVIITSLPWEEGFEGAFCPNGWTQLNIDDDNNMWFGYLSGGSAYTGTKCAASASRMNNTALNPDNWLISPKIHIPNIESYQNLNLSYWITAQDSILSQENYSVLVSTTNTDLASFTPLFTETLNNNNWTNIVLSLNPYSNQNIYLAFRHFDTTNMSYLKLDDVKIEFGMGNDIEPIIKTTRLENNYPNPFNPSTSIQYSLRTRSCVRIDIFNIKGQKVRTLIDEQKEAGIHSVEWNGKDDSNNNTGSGVYFYKMTTPDYSSVHKMILMK